MRTRDEKAKTRNCSSPLALPLVERLAQIHHTVHIFDGTRREYARGWRAMAERAKRQASLRAIFPSGSSQPLAESASSVLPPSPWLLTLLGHSSTATISSLVACALLVFVMRFGGGDLRWGHFVELARRTGRSVDQSHASGGQLWKDTARPRGPLPLYCTPASAPAGC